MTVLIIAASKSDVEVMKKCEAALEKNKIRCEMRVCSAHRTPEMLDKMLEDKAYDLIIAAAGLAAALPGVVAAKTPAPVIGVPLAGAFEGLDALLSIIQMPPGIPVLATGVNNSEEAAEAAAKITSSKANRVNLISAKNKSQKAMDKAVETLKQLGVLYSCSDKIRSDAINICFVDINEGKIPESDALTIYCPTAEKEAAADAIKLLQLTKEGTWVGLNRGENAAVAAAEIMKMKDKLTEYRWDMKRKIEEADREASKQC